DCCAIPSFDQLHLRRPQVRQDHALVATGALYVSCLTSSAQTIRAILLASATVTSMRGLRASICSSQEPLGAPRLPACFTTALLPMMSRRLSVRSPILDIAPSFCLPPVDLRRGVRPSQAAKSRPLAKLSAGGAKAAIAVADIGPIPGTVISLRDILSSRARRWQFQDRGHKPSTRNLRERSAHRGG